MLPHFLCVVLGHAVPFAVRRDLYILPKMSHESATPSSQHCPTPFALAFQSQNDSPLPFWMSTERPPTLYAYSSPLRPLSSQGTSISPETQLAPSSSNYMPVQHLYCAKRAWEVSKRLLRLVVAQVSYIALRLVVWVGGSLKRPRSPLATQTPSITTASLAPEPTAAPAPPIFRVKRRIRADKRDCRGRKLYVEVEEKGFRDVRSDTLLFFPAVIPIDCPP
ncbi:hypothetical protein C8F01DRAFT_1254773 [Mycena amicta]|nr:hypothetical protein C8F01DRAFT_1254773 [Mycena amicta]